MTDHLNPDHEPHHAESSTASLLTELQLYGHRPFQDEPDARPLPDEHAPSEPHWPTSSTPSSPPLPTRALSPTSKTCSGPPSTCSTAPPTGSNANSTRTSRRSAEARRTRTARKSVRSSWSGCWPKG